MARPNYNAAKRAKELKRLAKREAKLARKHARKAGEASADPSPEGPAPAGGPEQPDPGLAQGTPPDRTGPTT